MIINKSKRSGDLCVRAEFTASLTTAKANNLKPYEYLQRLLYVMMEHIYDSDTAYLDDLMPWSESLPDVCKKTF